MIISLWKELKPRNDKMDNYELKKVTQGKNRKQSLIFHVYDNVRRQDYELLIAHDLSEHDFTITTNSL